MYQTCISCTRPLGSNEVVEHFPVGRRLAFDGAKGRLWVVCRKCKRWNLTPLEERWEAIEECERFYRATRTRVSTENIGIARHPEGLQLVRIGKPLRPEFAAWRYGDQFGERRKQLVSAFAIGVPSGLGAAAALAALPTVAMGIVIPAVSWPYLIWLYRRPVARVRLGATAIGERVRPDNLARFRLLDLATIRVLPDNRDPGFRVEVYRGARTRRFAGENARRVAATVVPLVNAWGLSRKTVQAAVAEIASHRHPGRFLSAVARQRHTDRAGRTGYVKSMPKPTRLALEMALHEERERRALEGELWVLEQAWKEAEEIAGIADNLLLPAETDEFFERHGGEASNE